MPRLTVLLLVAGLLLLAACDGGGPAAPTPTATVVAPTASPTSPPEAADTPTPEAAATLPFEGTRGPVEKQVPDPGIALLTDVRTGRHDEGYDRVAFEFGGGNTGYLIRYVDPPITEDPSGLPVDIDGNAFLQIVLFSATGVDLSGPEPVFTCCRSEITTGLPALVDLQNAGDFEATLTWVLGLREEVDFRVGEFQNPYRIYIDVKHP